MAKLAYAASALGGTSRSTTAGEARIALATSASPAFAGFVTSRTYDLRESAVSVEISAMPRAVHGVQVQLKALDAVGNRVGMLQENGLMAIRLESGGSAAATVQEAAWNGDMRWRIRDDGSSSHFETSSNGGWSTFQPMSPLSIPARRSSTASTRACLPANGAR